MGGRSPSRWWRCALLLLALALAVAEGRFVVEKNSLRVTSPAALRGVYECAIGNFGMPQYGGTMHGVVVYPKANRKGCKAFSDSGLSFNPKSGGLPVFLLVDRGDCYFTTKGWNAQTAGAAAVLVADDREEPLITMDTPESAGKEHLENITVPSALVSKRFGDDLKTALENGDMVNVLLDWRESLPHPDERVEYEFWTNSNDECGAKCDMQMNFVRNFRGVAQVLEQRGYTQFAPHYITWYCPEAFVLSKQCTSQCINHGRYCAPDPEQDFTTGYDGKDVVVQNLIQICLFKVANESRKPWLWWDYVHDFAIRCPMKEKKYTRDCANGVIKSLGMDIDKINKCVGDPDADEDNPVLKAEQDAQIGHGSRGDVTILPTFVVNNRQYRGKLDKRAVLRAICSGFEETTEPDICLTQDIQTNQCLENNGGCWLDNNSNNFTACKDTFRGRVCECPIVNGVKFVGDGYTHCEASGVGRCQINNGGCWKETRNGKSVSACSNEVAKGCKCPPGFKGDGIHSCEDIDECKEKLFCQCNGCSCENTWGSYECGCGGNNMLYMREDTQATQDLRDNFLGLYDHRYSASRLSDNQRKTPEHVGATRTSGVTQTALGKSLDLKPGNFCYVVKSLQSKGLIVGNRAIVKSNNGAGGGTKVVSTNSLYLTRYAKQSNVSSYQKIEITEPKPGSDEESNVDALQEEEEDGTLNKSHVSVHDYLPSMKAIYEKLEEASGKVLAVADIKKDLSYSMQGRRGHRAWRSVGFLGITCCICSLYSWDGNFFS